MSLGMTARAIEGRLSSGAWVRVHPSVYRVASFPDVWRGRLMAAQRWGGDDSLISHRSALALYRLDGFREGPIDISIGSGKKRDGISVHRFRKQPTARWLDGLHVTSIERSLLDSCALCSPRVVGLAMDDALRQKKTTLEKLGNESMDGLAGKPGAGDYGELVRGRDDRDGRVSSELETRLLRILKRIEVARAIPQFEVVDGHRRYFIDFYYPGDRLGIEGLGLRWHFGDDRWNRDLARHDRLTLLGIRMLYYTWDQVTFEPERVEHEVRTALAATRPVQPPLGWRSGTG